MRKEKLLKLYELVGGTDAVWISDFQVLYNYPVGNPNLTLPLEETFENVADWGVKFKDIRAIIRYEHRLQQEFNKIELDLTNKIANQDNPNKIKKLYSELEDVLEAIRVSYVTLNENYQDFEERFYIISEDI